MMYFVRVFLAAFLILYTLFMILGKYVFLPGYQTFRKHLKRRISAVLWNLPWRRERIVMLRLGIVLLFLLDSLYSLSISVYLSHVDLRNRLKLLFRWMENPGEKG